MTSVKSFIELVLVAAAWLVAAQQSAPAPTRGSEPFRIVEATIPQMQAAMASGQLTARELVTQYLVRLGTASLCPAKSAHVAESARNRPR